MGERELAGVLREAGWPGARRGQQRSGLDQSDVVDGPEGWHFEVKRVEHVNIWKAMAQARRDAQGLWPVVATRKSGERWLAVLDLERFLALVRAAELDDLIGERSDGSP